MLYYFLRFIFSPALRIFFKEYRVNHKIDIPKEGPLIVVCNHPSTFMDPIIVASILRQDVHFIAAGSLFNSTFKNWFMRSIAKSIPVHRRQDNPEKMGGNDAIFEQCFDFLETGGTLIIFPEGTSVNERKLRNIKTGAARMALGAEARNDFKLGVKILSVGLNYSDAPSFRSDVWINVEELIHVGDFQKEYRINDRQAVNSLTDKIRKNLEKNIIIAQDSQEDQFISDVEIIYRNEWSGQLNLDPKLHRFALTKGIQEAVGHFRDLDQKWLFELQGKVSRYTKRLNEYQLDDSFLARNQKEGKSIFTESLFRFFFLFLGAPLFVYGFISNYIPYRLPKIIAHALSKEAVYIGPIKMTSGILIFPIFYMLWIYLFQLSVAHENWWWMVIFAISLPLAGFFALSYAQRCMNLRMHGRLIFLFRKKPELIRELLTERKIIIRELDWAKEQYFTED